MRGKNPLRPSPTNKKGQIKKKKFKGKEKDVALCPLIYIYSIGIYMFTKVMSKREKRRKTQQLGKAQSAGNHKHILLLFCHFHL